MVELEGACKDPADLFIQILAHSTGEWPLRDVEEAVKYVQQLREPKVKAVD